MRKLLILIALLAPVGVSAQGLQGAPVWPGVTLPTFTIPASAVNGGGVFPSQLLGPDSCVAYSFASAPTTGYGYDGTNLCVNFAGSTTGIFNATGFNTANGKSIGLASSGTSPNIFLQPQAAGNLMQRNGAVAQRWDITNTYTSSTNYEAFSVDWQTLANVSLVGTRTAATGTQRPMRLVTQRSSGAGTYTIIGMDNAAPYITFAPRSTESLNTQQAVNDTGSIFTFTGLHVGTSGQVNWTTIAPTYNQPTATTSNTDLLINRTETAVGSGAQYSIQAQRGGTNQFTVTAGTAGKGTQISAAQATPPTCSTNCGTSVPTQVGSDSFMTITMGSGGAPASGFVVTFNGTWPVAPSCTGVMALSGMAIGKLPMVIVTTQTTMTVTTNGTAPSTNDKYHFHCGGVQ